MPLLCAIAIAWVPPQARACLCGGVSYLEAFDSAELIFRGKVTADERCPGAPNDILPVEHHVSFLVCESWKGEPADTVMVCQYAGGVGCGVSFAVGAEYLVFGHTWRSGNRCACVLRTSECSRTAEVSVSGGLQALLNLPYPSAPDAKRRERELSRGLLQEFRAGTLSLQDLLDAVEALRQPDTVIPKTLIPVWERGDHETRQRIGEFLRYKHLGTPSELRLLLRVCADTSVTVRECGILALGPWVERAEEARAAVRTAMADSAEPIRSRAAQTLRRATGKARDRLVRDALRDRSARVRLTALEAVARQERPHRISWRELAPLFERGSSEERVASLIGAPYVQSDSTELASLFGRVVHDPDPAVRAALVDISRDVLRGGDVLQVLLPAALADTAYEHTPALLSRAFTIDDPNKRRALLQLAANHPRAEVRSAAIRSAASARGCESILRMATIDPEPRVRASAVLGIGKSRYPPDSLKIAAVSALSGERSTEVIEELARIRGRLSLPAFLILALDDIAACPDSARAAAASKALQGD